MSFAIGDRVKVAKSAAQNRDQLGTVLIPSGTMNKPPRFVRDQELVAGLSTGNPSVIPNPRNPRLLHLAYRKAGAAIKTRTFNRDTEALSVEVELRSSGVDPALIYKDPATLWAIYSNNDNDVLLRISKDNGATWTVASTVLIDESGDGGHYEDLDIVALPNGNIMVVAEWEVTNLLASAIDAAIWDGSTWTQTRVIPVNGTVDYEGPALCVDGDAVHMIVAHNEAGGVSYHNNMLYIYTSHDFGVTWGAGRLLLAQKSHVEYKMFKHEDIYYVADTRNYDGTDPTALTGIHVLGKTLKPKRITDNNWDQIQATAVVGDGYCDVMENTGERPTFVRSVPDGGNVDVRFTDLQCRGTTTADIRIYFGFTDLTHHYVWLLGVSATQLYYIDGGAYTTVGDSVARTTVMNAKYDVRVVFDGVNDTQDLYIDGVLIDQQTSDKHSTGSVGWGGGQEATQPEKRQPIRCGRIEVVGQWTEEWNGYATFAPLAALGDIKFTGCMISDGPYVVLEDRDNDAVTLFRMQTQRANSRTQVRLDGGHNDGISLKTTDLVASDQPSPLVYDDTDTTHDFG